MIPLKTIGTYTGGTKLRDLFAEEANGRLVRIQTGDADINPGYLLGVREQSAGPDRVFQVFRVAYCVNATKGIWKVIEVDRRKIVQLDALDNQAEGGRKFSTRPIAYKGGRVHYA